MTTAGGTAPTTANVGGSVLDTSDNAEINAPTKIPAPAAILSRRLFKCHRNTVAQTNGREKRCDSAIQGIRFCSLARLSG